MGNDRSTGTNEVRRNFIAMLFALVVATIASQIAGPLSVVSEGWEQPTAILEGLLDPQGLLLAPLAHLFLTLLLVSMSWIGWSASLAKGHKADIQSFLSAPFFLMLLEVLLVTLYFALTTIVEGERSHLEMLPAIGTFSREPSARPEAAVFIVIYSVYAVWDFFADVLPSRLASQRWKETIYYLTGLLTYCSISLICAAFCLLIYVLLPVGADPCAALWGDLALILILLFFHKGKRLEYYPLRFFPWEQKRNSGTRRTEPLSGTDWAQVLFLLGIIAVPVFILSGVFGLL